MPAPDLRTRVRESCTAITDAAERLVRLAQDAQLWPATVWPLPTQTAPERPSEQMQEAAR